MLAPASTVALLSTWHFYLPLPALEPQSPSFTEMSNHHAWTINQASFTFDNFASFVLKHAVFLCYIYDRVWKSAHEAELESTDSRQNLLQSLHRNNDAQPEGRDMQNG